MRKKQLKLTHFTVHFPGQKEKEAVQVEVDARPEHIQNAGLKAKHPGGRIKPHYASLRGKGH